MTPRERVETVLRGGRADHVPFTVYDTLLPKGEAERRLRNEGACVVSRVAPFKVVRRDVQVEQTQHEEDGARHVRTTYRTPEGDLSTVARSTRDSEETYHSERLFKGPEDYRAIECLIRDEQPEPDYESLAQAQAALGDSGIVVADLGYSPMQELMQTVMGIDQFAVEWSTRQDEVLRIYEALVENRRRIISVAAAAPGLAVNYCGNVSAEVVGVERFEDYYVPHYNECAEAMHSAGKVMGVHFDANTWALADLIGATDIDYVEALTPRPDGDMTVAEARTDWHDKILWINFPYSAHQDDVDGIEHTTRRLMWEAAPGDRLLIGITEAVPADRWEESFGTILQTVKRDGQLPITWSSPSQRAFETDL